MYFRAIASVKTCGELTELEKNHVKTIREEIVADFLLKKHRLDLDKDTFKYLTECIEGCLYQVETTFDGKPASYQYFISNFEFGPPRNFDEDHRFDLNWKEHMIKYLRKYAPAYVQNYLKEWSERYIEYRNHLRKNNSPEMLKEFDLNTKTACDYLNFEDDSAEFQ